MDHPDISVRGAFALLSSHPSHVVFIFAAPFFFGCASENTRDQVPRSHITQTNSKRVYIGYSVPTAYSLKLAGAAYRATGDPVFQSPEIGSGVIAEMWPSDSLAALGLPLRDRAAITYVGSSNMLHVSAEPAWHQALISLHVREGIKIIPTKRL